MQINLVELADHQDAETEKAHKIAANMLEHKIWPASRAKEYVQRYSAIALLLRTLANDHEVIEIHELQTGKTS